MTDGPLVSIGLPVYNGADQLAAAIESALGQDYENVEIVVCDNASEDDTEAIGRRFAEADARVRYFRNPSNIGFLPNFRRVLEEARGRYFSWLAHDDLLSDPAYISTVVQYMERHPDVVVCSTDLYLLDNEVVGSVETISFPELAPDRWPESRCELFKWPHWWLDATVYGVFRRDELTRIPIVERRYRGRSHIFCWEMDLLTELSGFGRVVALPGYLRSYRTSPESMGSRILQEVSTFDLFLLGLGMKLKLIRRAGRLRVDSLRDRMKLIETTLGNLFRANFKQPYDLRFVMNGRERELELLLKVYNERAELIESVRAEIDARRAIAEEHGLDVAWLGNGPAVEDENSGGLLDGSLGSIGTLEKKGSRGFLSDFFRPLADWQVQYFHQLNAHIGKLRGVCERQLRTINELHADAEKWLEVLAPLAEQSESSGSAADGA